MSHVKSVLQPGQVPKTVNKGDKGIQGIQGNKGPSAFENILVWEIQYDFIGFGYPPVITRTVKIIEGNLFNDFSNHSFATDSFYAIETITNFLKNTVVNPRLTSFVNHKETKGMFGGNFVTVPDNYSYIPYIRIGNIINSPSSIKWGFYSYQLGLFPWSSLTGIMPPGQSRFVTNLTIIAKADSV